MKKINKCLLVLALVALFLVGCTKATSTPSATEVPTSTPTDAATPTPTVSPTPAMTADMDDIKSIDLIKEFTVGWNLGNTLDATGGTMNSSETSWGNPKATQELIDTVIAAGFNVIRIPVTWGNHLGAGYQINDKWMARVKEVVDYAYNRGVYVILNTHHEDWITTKEEDYEENSKKLCIIWQQIAEEFRDYDEHLLFEGLNEPRNIGSSQEWTGGTAKERVVVDKLNTDFYKTVRATGGNNSIRSLVFTSYGGNPSETACKAVTLPKDDYVIMNVHSYSPYNFALNTSGTDKWSADNKNDTNDINWLCQTLKKLYVDKGIAVIIDEFGNVDKDNTAARAENNKYYVQVMKDAGIPCVIWDNGVLKKPKSGEALGLIDRTTYEWVYPEIIDAIMSVFK